MSKISLINKCLGVITGVAIASALSTCEAETKQFRTSNIPAKIIPVGTGKIHWTAGLLTMYNRMDSDKNTIFINGQAYNPLDNIRIDNPRRGRKNLFVVDEATPDTLRLKWVGYNSSQ
ncbi:MAG: hypothetical protein KKB31_01730 [Nanoarchaeota archaeon]|nr:hypothetical protein [Nanoarchaeota archaeon]